MPTIVRRQSKPKSALPRKEAMPWRIHSAMRQPYNETAITFFGPEARSNISARLPFKAIATGPKMTILEDKSSALDDVAVACWRYARGVAAGYSPAAIRRQTFSDLHNTAAALQNLIGSMDPQTDRWIEVGMDRYLKLNAHDREQDEWKDFDSRDYNHGMLQLSILSRKLELLIAASLAAKGRKAVAPRQTGRRAKSTSELELALCHVLADIWCRYTNENFSAPAKRLDNSSFNRRALRGALFVDIVLNELAGILSTTKPELLPGESRRRLYELVRTHRIKAGAGVVTRTE